MARQYTQCFVAVGSIIEQNGKILLVQENMPTHPDHMKWNQPAGWLDIGENPIDAAIRETKEETGLDFKPTGLLGIYSLVRNDMTSERGTPHAIKIIFRGEITSEEIDFDKEEINDARWFTPEEIYSMDSSTLRDADIKQEIKDYLEGKSISLEHIAHTFVR